MKIELDKNMNNFRSLETVSYLNNLNKKPLTAFGIKRTSPKNNERPAQIKTDLEQDKFVKSDLGKWGTDEVESKSVSTNKDLDSWAEIDEAEEPEDKEVDKTDASLSWGSTSSSLKKHKQPNSSFAKKAVAIASGLTASVLALSLGGKVFSASEKKSYTPVIEELAPTEQVETQAKAFNLESEIPAPPRVQQQVQPSVQESRININNRNLEGKKVIIDPGHGGKDSGAVGNGLLEKDITLEFSKAIKQALNEHKINVKLTRNGDYENQFPTYLDEYKTDKDAFISIHANSVDNPSVCGVEIFAEDHTESYKLANTIYKHIKQDLGAEFSSHCSNWDRGVKAASTSRARFISRAGSPSVLVETAFISNANDAKIFKDPQLKTKLIKAIAEGTEEYLAKK